jgi:hypothetical protein
MSIDVTNILFTFSTCDFEGLLRNIHDATLNVSALVAISISAKLSSFAPLKRKQYEGFVCPRFDAIVLRSKLANDML